MNKGNIINALPNTLVSAGDFSCHTALKGAVLPVWLLSGASVLGNQGRPLEGFNLNL